MDNGVLGDVVARFASESALCWTSRDAAVHSPAYDLQELADLDDRLERHLEGLRHAADLGWEHCAAALDEGEAGEVFAAAVMALDRRDFRAFAAVLDVAAEVPAAARGVVSALGWGDPPHIELVLRALVSPGVPESLLHIGIAGHAIHRRDPGAVLGRAASSDDARLRARALRAIGELRRTDLGHVLRNGLEDPDEACRFWSAWSAALGRDDRALAVLQALAQGGGPLAERAAEMAVRLMDVGHAEGWIETLAGRGEGGVRAAIVGAGALGEPKLVPFLLAHLRDDKTARLAAWSVSLITNADMAGALGGDAPKGFKAGPSDDPDDADVAMDPDSDLPWPDVAAVEAWWAEAQQRWPAGSRYLFGASLRPEWLEQVLVRGNQAARAAAAVEQCLKKPGLPLFEVRAPGHVQLAALGAGGVG